MTLAEAYARIPAIACKGLCVKSCGPIAMDRVEADAIAAKMGKPLGPVGDDLACKALACGQCMVYEVRPLICRLWGVVRQMQCPYGCVPERWISDAEAGEMLNSVVNRPIHTFPVNSNNRLTEIQHRLNLKTRT